MHFLLHTCCAPCAVYIISELKKRSFLVTAFFYNPNIYPQKEYEKRRDELKNYCQKETIEFIQGEYDYQKWQNVVEREFWRSLDSACPESFGLAQDKLRRRTWDKLFNEPEGGKRCEVCYKIRLEKIAVYAKENDYNYFGTTLSVSPYKKSETINKIGLELADKYNLEFFDEDWKKKDGFRCACELSREHGFYRQNYCGCAYSLGHQSTGTREHKTKNVYSVPVLK